MGFTERQQRLADEIDMRIFLGILPGERWPRESLQPPIRLDNDMLGGPITEEWLRNRASGPEDAGVWYVPGFMFRGEKHRIVVVRDFNLWKWSRVRAGYSGPNLVDHLDPLPTQPQDTLEAVRLLADHGINVLG